MSTSDTTLVLGGTGKIGRRVAALLSERGHPVRIGSRSGAPPFDWDDRSTWAAVLDGVGAAAIAFAPDLSVPGADEATGAFAREARIAGVGRLTLLSGRGEDGALAAERAVAAEFPAVTIVRASWFMQAFSEAIFRDAVVAGTIALPAGQVAEPFVDAADIAEIVTVALTGDGHEGRLYEVTGPRALTFGEVAAELSMVTGRNVEYESMSPRAYGEMLASHGVPHEEIAMLTDLFAEVLDGRNTPTADGVQQALGRRPRDFSSYARDAADQGAWAEGVS